MRPAYQCFKPTHVFSDDLEHIYNFLIPLIDCAVHPEMHSRDLWVEYFLAAYIEEQTCIRIKSFNPWPANTPVSPVDVIKTYPLLNKLLHNRICSWVKLIPPSSILFIKVSQRNIKLYRPTDVTYPLSV